MNDQWKTNSSNIIYDSKWLKLIRDEVTTPEGKVRHYDIVERENVAIIIPVMGASLCMVEQFRYPVSSRSLEFPQGFCEEGEDKEQCAVRELSEETGLNAHKVTFLGELWVSSGFLRQKLFIFVAKELTEGDQHLDETETGLEIIRLSQEEVLQSISDGTISNAPTVAALGLYLLSNDAAILK